MDTSVGSVGSEENHMNQEGRRWLANRAWLETRVKTSRPAPAFGQGAEAAGDSKYTDSCYLLAFSTFNHVTTSQRWNYSHDTDEDTGTH